MSNCTPASILLLSGLILFSDNSPATEEKEREIKKIPYYETLGLLIELQVAIQPNLSFAVNVLLCFAHNPRKRH